jgi:hypothetical protein
MRHETASWRSIIFASAVLLLAIPAQLAMAHPAEERLKALRECLPAKYDAELTKLSNGLLRNWKPVSTELPPPPTAYLASLDQDIRVCRLAAGMADAKARDAVTAVIAKDIEIKTEDCRKFGMGRMVPVHVRTVLDGAPSNGWQVFYKWVGSSLLKAQELPFPTLTSPAKGELPPGIYVIRVEKQGIPTLAQAARPVTIVVGSEAVKEVEIAVR